MNFGFPSLIGQKIPTVYDLLIHYPRRFTVLYLFNKTSNSRNYKLNLSQFTASLAGPHQLSIAGHICAYFATCRCEPLTMLNPHFVAGEHGLFGAHESEDIRTILIIILCVA